MIRSSPLKPLLPVLLLAISTVLAACSDNPPTANPSVQATIISALSTSITTSGSEPTNTAKLDLTTIDPCALLTRDEITSLMGNVPVSPRPITRNQDHTACSYVDPTLQTNSPLLFLSVESPDYFDRHTGEVQPLIGLGDRAETAEFDGWRTLWVLLKNKATIQIDIYPKNTAIAQQLIQKAIDRLP